MRIVNEQTNDESTWLQWTLRAFQSIYGYEYQGDNLLIARVNLLLTFVEYCQAKWNHEPSNESILQIANVISWNLW